VRLPDFLGIGTQKGGTTYLHYLLAQHPQVYLASPKELHFFTLKYYLGIDWYVHHFEAARFNQKCGEVTPYYLFHPLAAERIFLELPHAKLIVLLRDPVDRALSQYFHSRRLGLETLELESAFEAEQERLVCAEKKLCCGESHFSHQQHSYISRSQYEHQLERFSRYFSENQILVLRSEFLFERPVVAWSKILHFLEIDDFKISFRVGQYSGESESDSVSSQIRNHLKAKLQSTYAWLEQR